MLSLLLITALAVQAPPASKPAQDTSATKRTTTSTRAQQQATPRDDSRAPSVSRMAFHDRMRELWTDHIVYTREFIVSSTGGLADTAEATQRLLRNQDEIGEAIKPYYGDAAGSQLASLLRGHIQLAGKALTVAKGNSTQTGMNVNRQTDTTGLYVSPSNRLGENKPGENRMNDTTRNRDTIQVKTNSQNPTDAARLSDTTKARKTIQGSDTSAVRPTGDTTRAKQQVQQGQYPTARVDQIGQNNAFAQNAQQTDSTALNQAVAALRANADSIATLLNKANPRGFALGTLRDGLNMHITLLLQEATAHVKRDWSGSIAAFDQSLDQALQMADMLSEGIMKQFPSRFSNRPTNVSSMR